MDIKDIRCTKDMKTKIYKLEESDFKISGNREKIWPDFYEEKGFILFGEKMTFTDSDVKRIVRANYDMAGFESSFSEFNIGDYFDVENPEEALRIALIISEIWGCKLRNMFPCYAFRIIIAIEDEDVNLRYYRHRDGEMELFGDDDIEDRDGFAAIRYVDP
ncbi:hypothetical protein [Butyrivibrio proteoclasticus]|uniref:hypothetical protein n=1 Tax=Butyrivibrio proteoclasticus TaxID=43305 RepID=UPI00047C35BB|nr:hypothetical protein [Butyrivibrio proteoclasticus]